MEKFKIFSIYEIFGANDYFSGQLKFVFFDYDDLNTAVLLSVHIQGLFH